MMRILNAALPWGEPEFVDVRKAIKAENRPTFDE